jgi:hypothetical protein
VTYLHINTVVLPLSAVALVANGALRGAGDSVPGLISTMVTRAVVAVALAYILAFPVGLGSLGVWIALAIGIVLDAIYMGIRWRSNVWLDVALHQSDLYRTHLRHLPKAVQEQYLREVRTPLMATPTARERVDAQGVVYVLPDREVTVRFNDQAYQLAAL